MTVYWPAASPRVTEEAGTRGGTHSGIDLAAERGDPVLAPFDGVAVYVGGDGAGGRLWLGDRWLYPNGEGKTIDIQRADGLISRVGHLEGYAIRQGDQVRAGQVIGYAGDSGYSTGVHIHWELRWDRAWSGGNWINPRSMAPQIHTTAARTTTTRKKRKSMATLYCTTSNDKRPGSGGTGANWYLAGDSPGTDANWLRTQDQTVANGWAAAHGDAVWLTKASAEAFKKMYLQPLRTR